jgi:hypothetical protein
MIYNKEELAALLKRGETETITLECDNNCDARRLSFALRRTPEPNFSVRISVSQSTITLSPRLPSPQFTIKEPSP